MNKGLKNLGDLRRVRFLLDEEIIEQNGVLLRCLDDVHKFVLHQPSRLRRQQHEIDRLLFKENLQIVGLAEFGESLHHGLDVRPLLLVFLEVLALEQEQEHVIVQNAVVLVFFVEYARWFHAVVSRADSVHGPFNGWREVRDQDFLKIGVHVASVQHL